ncbi:hypothetical protein [Helicobacter pullorum]|uniref:hypothetical protein n=1 Tax=Helicobacter pullorum TaxID=35818 RepID=UPI001DD70960|nr:hypothetical protein [Helicobacter pullorum]HJF82893.1 hypothetical protein [Helicobacter pullorum]
MFMLCGNGYIVDVGGGGIREFSNKQSIPLRANQEVILDPRISYFFKVSVRVISSFNYARATQGAGIFVDNKHFSTIWASNSGSVGQVFDWQGYLSGSSLKLLALKTKWVTTQPSHFKFTSAELYF